MTPYRLLGETREIRQATEGSYKGQFFILRAPSERWTAPFANMCVFTEDGNFDAHCVLYADSPEALIEKARRWADKSEMTLEELEYLEVEGW